jgi:LysM repeat protein
LLLDEDILHWYNATMRKFRLVFVILLSMVGMILTSCTVETPIVSSTPVETQASTLRPYPSDTPSTTPSPTGYNSPTPSPTITPTTTPVYYEIQLGDDMYSIAWRYGISPQAIMTANPTVNPNAMIVGESLLIPITPTPEATTTVPVKLSPTATLVYGNLHEPDCYRDAVEGLWCFVLVENDLDGSLENVSGVVTLEESGETRQETAILPLNILPAGESLPLIAYFQPSVSNDFSASAQVDFWLPVMQDDQRYLDVEIVKQEVQVNEDGQIARVTGELHLPEDGPGAEYVWVNATAFDADGNVLGVRRWDRLTPLSPGSELPFDLTVYSLGGEIDHVTLLVEARAVHEQGEED